MDRDQEDAKRAKMEMGYTGHTLTTMNLALAALNTSQRSTMGLEDISQEESHRREMEMMQEKMTLLEKHYANQQDLHLHQQQFWEKQRDTSNEQMNNLTTQHTELIEMMKKVPLGGGNSAAVQGAAIPAQKMLTVAEIKEQQEAVISFTCQCTVKGQNLVLSLCRFNTIVST